jgi:hypothetical protein
MKEQMPGVRCWLKIEASLQSPAQSLCSFILAFVRKVYLSWGTLSTKASALYEAADFSG